MFKTKPRLFLLSFLILFLELSLIRYISAHILMVGFFSNLILLGTFLGIGVGMLLSKRKINLLYIFPFLLGFLIVITTLLHVEVDLVSSEVMFFQSNMVGQLPPEIILPLIFLITALIFLPLGQALGKLFITLKPLVAYSIDIGGSIAGILVFSFLSFLWTPPHIWFLVISLITFFIIPKRNTFFFYICSIILISIPLFTYAARVESTWSPYYQIRVKQSDQGYAIAANNIGHQVIGEYVKTEPFYKTPYRLFNPHDFKKILVIGSGAGNDVAAALLYNPTVERIDAVEIDPVIQNLGKMLHSYKPYQDPRVHTYIGDGRAFLENTKEKYDLVIFALTDSITIHSHSSNIRLESFIFTKESFQKAKEHLNNNGLFVLYNYYGKPWVIDKIAFMLHETFNQHSLISSQGTIAWSATIMAGPKIKEIEKPGPFRQAPLKQHLSPASDDWPFLYLKTHTIPGIYIRTLTIIFLISLILIITTTGTKTLKHFDFRFFFLGVGFMILEVKSLVTFNVLFGTTWFVNALVFAAIFCGILIANFASHYISIKSFKLVYCMLFFTLLLQFIIPPSQFLSLNPALRYVTASLFYFAPIILANFIFSQRFKDSKSTDIAFGSNMLGALVGGILEYTSLIIGFKMLTLFSLFFYALSFIKYSFKK